jgi:hypothetical protein
MMTETLLPSDFLELSNVTVMPSAISTVVARDLVVPYQILFLSRSRLIMMILLFLLGNS